MPQCNRLLNTTDHVVTYTSSNFAYLPDPSNVYVVELLGVPVLVDFSSELFSAEDARSKSS